MGVIPTKKSLVQLERLSTAAFCRRRLAVVMVRLRMAESLREACTFVEQVPAFRAALPEPARCILGQTIAHLSGYIRLYHGTPVRGWHVFSFIRRLHLCMLVAHSCSIGF